MSENEEIPWWQGWRAADPRDEALARALCPFSSNPDDMVVVTDSPAIGHRTPLGDVRVVIQKGYGEPVPLWTCFLNLAAMARKRASDPAA